MSTFIFKKERNPENEFDIAEITMKLQAGTLPEVIEEFGRFLVACGYSAEGVARNLNTEEM